MNKEKNQRFFYPSIFPKSRKAAIEMSMTTFVTIVLVVIVMVMGIFFVQKTFKSGTTAIDGIDPKTQSEIDSLFADEGRPLVIYPKERKIEMNQGDSGGFGFSILNKDFDDGIFTYEVIATEIASSCQLTKAQADSLIVLGQGRDYSVNLGSGAKLDDAILVKFQIPETAPLCLVRYQINVEKNGKSYTSSTMDLEII